MPTTARLEKDHAQRMSSMTAQREKLEQSYKKDVEQLANRKSDLDKQLDIMQMKYKVLHLYIFPSRSIDRWSYTIYNVHADCDSRNEWRSFLSGKIKCSKNN